MAHRYATSSSACLVRDNGVDLTDQSRHSLQSTIANFEVPEDNVQFRIRNLESPLDDARITDHRPKLGGNRRTPINWRSGNQFGGENLSLKDQTRG